jgi:hypothetical protein
MTILFGRRHEDATINLKYLTRQNVGFPLKNMPTYLEVIFPSRRLDGKIPESVDQIQ